MYEVFSAGTHPGAVRPEAVTVMREISVDISAQRSKPMTMFRRSAIRFRHYCLRQGPRRVPRPFRRDERLHWPFEDPASFIEVGEERLHAFRRLRDRIHARVMVFLGEGAYGSKEPT